MTWFKKKNYFNNLAPRFEPSKKSSLEYYYDISHFRTLLTDTRARFAGERSEDDIFSAGDSCRFFLRSGWRNNSFLK